MYLEEGLCGEILKNLLVDALCRFRCVCKSWNSLISSSSFIKSHYLTSSNISPMKKRYIIFNTRILRPTRYAIYDPRILDESYSHHHIDIVFRTVPFKKYELRFLGVIHGVVCLCRRKNAILWNPAMRKFLKIPGRKSIRMRVVGFGFDACKNDFKVIRTPEDREKATSFEVYSSREGQWRSLNSDHIGLFEFATEIMNGCFKNGVIHWIIQRRSIPNMSVLMFDCEREEFKTMEIPQRLNQQPNLVVEPYRVLLHLGKVSVLVSEVTKEKDEVAVWVMEEYGVETSWKRTDHHKDFATMGEIGVCKLKEGGFCDTWCMKGDDDRDWKRSRRPNNSHVYEPSMLLMDAESESTLGEFSEDPFEEHFRLID